MYKNKKTGIVGIVITIIILIIIVVLSNTDLNKISHIENIFSSIVMPIQNGLTYLKNKVDGNDHRVYALLGDGECEEGEVWEVAMAASHYKLDNLCAILDYNHLQIDGNIEDVISPEPFMSKFEAFGWNVLDVNGHDFDELRNAFNQAKQVKDKPTIIIAHTIKGKGVSFMENNYAWHGAAPNDEQYETAMKELGGLE